MQARLPSFWIKAALAVGLIAAADFLLFDRTPGLNLGLFALGLSAALALANPGVRATRLPMVALALAALFAALQLERPTFVGALLFVVAIGVAALAARAPAADDGWRWAQRLVAAGFKSLAGPVFDLHRLLKARARSRTLKVTAVLLAAMLPVWGGALFLWLFATANPVIEQGLASLRLPEADLGRGVFWSVVGLTAWAVLRPRGLRRTVKRPGLDGDVDVPGVTTASIAASLTVFNVLFAVQNGLDIAFLWSGAGLPEGVTFADYAHRGAYSLIATALLAGLFVLLFLRPGSATAAQRPIRALVVLWVAQTLFLVASTARRTLDYVDAYSLTRVRIAALLWMGLVAMGLVLVCWRLLRAKSSSWLINANLLAVGLVQALCSFVDLGAVAAHWNVRHAREVGGRGVNLDVCYLEELEGSAIVSLAELEQRPLAPELRSRVVMVRHLIVARIEDRQSHWRSWRFRDARRLARMRAVLGGEGAPWPLGVEDNCEARPLARPKPPMPAVPPLTPTPNPGT